MKEEACSFILPYDRQNCKEEFTVSTKKRRYATNITLSNGRRVYISSTDKADFESKVLQAKLAAGAGVDIGNDISFREYAETWIQAYKKPKLRPNSLGVLQANLKNHVLPFFGDMLVREIRPVHIQLFLSGVSGLSQSTQKKCWDILSGIFRTAQDNGVILKSPIRREDRPSGEAPEAVEALTREQAKALLEATRGCKVYTFCLIALTTGLRRGEILGLMWEDVDLDAGILTVRHNKAFLPDQNDVPVTTLLKTEAAHRRIPMPYLLIAHLKKELARSHSNYVLSMENGESLTKSSFRRMWSAIAVRTATPERALGSRVSGGRDGPIIVSLDFDCHPHQLRHTCITQWVESDMKVKQVQYLAGHSTLEMTLKVYSHYRRKSQEDEVAASINAATDYLAG